MEAAIALGLATAPLRRRAELVRSDFKGSSGASFWRVIYHPVYSSKPENKELRISKTSTKER